MRRLSRSLLLLLSAMMFASAREGRGQAIAARPAPPTQDHRIGLVLTGGGSFGAWEVGAIQALYEAWKSKFGEEPPIVVAAGTSTGALIAPFAILNREAIKHLATWYTEKIKKNTIYHESLLYIPTRQSIGDFGYPTRSHPSGRYLYTAYQRALDRTFEARRFPAPDSYFRRAIKEWPAKRFAVTATDFADGTGRFVTSCKDDDAADPSYNGSLFKGIFASCVPPLIGPEVPLDGPDGELIPYFDGGIYSQAPFDALFYVASYKGQTPIALTHVILISSYPTFAGSDAASIQKPRYPKGYQKASFMDIASRFDSLLSESGMTRDLKIARAALALRRRGASSADVEAMTGLNIPDPPPELIEAVPFCRLGWKPNEFKRKDMEDMLSRGQKEGKEIFEHALNHTPLPPKPCP